MNVTQRNTFFVPLIRTHVCVNSLVTEEFLKDFLHTLLRHRCEFCKFLEDNTVFKSVFYSKFLDFKHKDTCDAFDDVFKQLTGHALSDPHKIWSILFNHLKVNIEEHLGLRYTIYIKDKFETNRAYIEGVDDDIVDDILEQMYVISS
tara:strand:- start:10102 stop:10542 length:441 start_codon:yes stop_codon:yes gene_type:complete